MDRIFFWICVGLSLLGGVYLMDTSFKSQPRSPATPNTVLQQNSIAPAPAPAPAASASPQPEPVSVFAARFKDHLMVIGEDGFPHGFKNEKLAGIKYWAFYYSASWCPPSRAFTPELVNFYNNFKPSHPDFELIFVSEDNSDGDMVNYMKADSMPWPAVWYQDIHDPKLPLKQYSGPGIPCLVLVDADGHILSNSFRNDQYVGANTVMNEIGNFVQ